LTALSPRGVLWRIKDEKPYAVTGTKGYLWIESEVAAVREPEERNLDLSYFERLATEAIKTINAFGDFDSFIS